MLWEDFNVKVYNTQWMPSDGKKAHLSFWPCELKTVSLSIINSKCLKNIQAAKIIMFVICKF
jgi:hypothetical protein